MYNENGAYSVKSAYKFIRGNQHDTLVRLHNRNSEDPEFWKFLWNIQIQPKVRIFLWKMCKNILPVGVNVEEWIESSAPECPFCNLPETQTHALRECEWIRRRWKNYGEKELYEIGEGKSCIDWLAQIFRSASMERIQRFCAILWFLWKERCNHKYNNLKKDEEEIIPKALGWLSSFLEAQASPSSSSFADSTGNVNARTDRWLPPPEGVFKMNCDAGVIQQQGVRLGAVLRNWRGEFVGVMVKREKGLCRPIVAEAKAMVMGLREANHRSLSPLIVESDCQDLVNFLDKGEPDFTELGIWCKEIEELALENERLSGHKVRWRFSSRKTNSLAHWLAHSGLGWNHQMVWVDNPPSNLLCMVEADLGLGPLGQN
ncbi:unnamed protein product [Linum trigynum]|uniref:Uncharacterized protein n=1 Tax=Linum trigynum TaxID=586398 RepID=A0AAV2F5A6_9ROSI